MTRKEIDRYNYCSKDDVNQGKFNYYEKMEPTKIEKERTDSLLKRLDEYTILVHDSRVDEEFHYQNRGEIKYKENLGYVAIGNYDRDIVSVDFLGKEEDEAFNNAIMDLEFCYAYDYFLFNTEEILREYIPRLLNEYLEADRYHALIWAELSMKNIRKYYTKEVPQQITKYYEEHILKVDKKIVKYDINTNRFVKADLKIKKLEK